MFLVLIPIKQRITLCFYALYDGMVRWMKPRSTSLLPGTIADFAKGKPELLVENALLRQQLIILRRQVKRPACRKTDRFPRVASSEDDSDVEADALHCAAGDLAQGGIGNFSTSSPKHKSKADTRQPKLSLETIELIKKMARNNRRLRSGAHPR